MNSASTSLPADHAQPTLSSAMVALLAFCCGAVVANLYYAQPIVELIAPAIGLSTRRASLIVSLTQFGYAIGLLFLVPLADLLENRKLVIGFTLAVALCLAGAGLADSPSVLLACTLLIGLTSVAVQILTHLGVTFKAVNVLEDQEVREGIKQFSNWPTIPQLYVKGEFVGGADIIREMFEGDELKPFFAEKGIALENA